MNWLTVIWSMAASACLTLALIHFIIWFKQRSRIDLLLFCIVAIGVAGTAAGELAMMESRTGNEFGLYLRWTHVPLFVTMVCMVAFVKVHFGTGRLWLLCLFCALRTGTLIVNFALWPNLNYQSITGVRPVSLFGEMASVPVGVPSPWSRLGQAGALLFLLFVADASIALWRRASRADRRRAALIGGSMTFFVAVGVIESNLVHEGIIRAPYLISLPFLAPLFVMAYELGQDVVRAAKLAQNLVASQEELRMSELRMSLVADAAELGLWEWNIVADKIWMTDRCRTIFGITSPDGISFDELLATVHSDDRNSLREKVNHSLQNGGEYEAEYRLASNNGHTRWMASRGRVHLNGENKPELVRGVSIDITRRKQAEERSRLDVEEAARQRNELAHLSRVTMLGELSGSIAHELNQPLTAILSNAQAAQRFLAQNAADPQEVQEILKDIIAADNRAGETIYKLRALFKKGEVQNQPVEVNALLQEVLKFLNSDLINNRVNTAIELEDHLPSVKGDRVQLQQVVINLIVNACDAMASSDPSQRKLVLRTASNDDDVHISISDRGHGIPEESLEGIFAPFMTTKTHGMGLGLAVCRTIITAHGGKLWASNNADRGAMLHISLPAVTSAATPTPAILSI